MSLTPLLILQLCCCTATSVCFVALLLARLQVLHPDRNYELARGLIMAGLALLVAQFVIQMTMGIRAGGALAGAVVNILFYVPVVCLLSIASLRLSVGRGMRLYMVAAIAGTVLIYAIFIAGWLTYGSLHMPVAAYIMAVLFFAMCIFFAYAPNRERRRMRNRLKLNAEVDSAAYSQFIRTGVLLLATLSLTIALAIFSTRVLYVFGPLFELFLVYFTVSFICLDARMGAISTVIEEANAEADSQVVSDEGLLSEDYLLFLDGRVAEWREGGGFSDIDLNMTTMAEQLNVSPHVLSQYTQQRFGTTFRVWLSDLRIEEVKKLLLQHDDFKMEVIALSCGFSSRTWLQQKFKAATGMTPADWREQQIDLFTHSSLTDKSE